MTRPRSRPNSLANWSAGAKIARGIIERMLDNPEGRQLRADLRRMVEYRPEDWTT